MEKLQETLRNFRLGRMEYGTAHAQFTAAGWDPGDVDALLHNLNYTPYGDKAQQFIDQQQRQRRQPNALSRH